MRGLLRAHGHTVVVASVVALLPFWEIVAGRRTAIYGDAREQFIPSYAAVWDLIRSGRPPWWHPGMYSGWSLVGAGQFAVFYPFNALFGWLEATNAARWWLVFHLVLGVVGMYLWAFSRWRSRTGAVVAATSLSLCSFHVFHLVHLSYFAQASWLPFALWGVDRLAVRWTTGSALSLALPLAMIVALGGPQMVWISAIGLGTYGALVSGRTRARWRSDLRIGVGLLLGVGLGAVQLVPSWLFSRTSVRPGLDKVEAFSYAMQPRHLLNLVFPYAFGGASQPPGVDSPWLAGPYPMHEVMPYAGATVAVLACIGLWDRRRDRGARACLAMGLVGALVALGDSTPLGDAFYRLLPMASGFRAWGRVAFLTQLALAMLAAAGACAIRARPRAYVPALCGGVTAVTALAVLAPRISSVEEALAPGAVGLVSRLVPVLLVVLLLVAALLAVLHPRVVPALLVGVVALDLVSFAAAGEWYREGLSGSESEALFSAEEPPQFRPVHDAAGGTDRWASNLEFRGIALVTGTETVMGYDPLLQAEYAETVGGLVSLGYPTRADLWASAALSDVLRVTTLALTADIEPRAPGWRRGDPGPDPGIVRWERDPRLPSAYLVGAAEVTDLSAIRGAFLGSSDAGLSRRAFVEEPLELDLDEAGRAGRATSRGAPPDGDIEVEAERDALLVVSYAWMDGWEATVDGDPAPVVRANGLVLGVPVEAGAHRVRLRFVPPGLRAGALASLASALVLLGVAPAASRLGRRRARARPSSSELRPAPAADLTAPSL